MNTGIVAEAGDGARTHDPQLGKRARHRMDNGFHANLRISYRSNPLGTAEAG